MNKQKIVDYFVASAVFIQSALAIIQDCMIDIYHIDEGVATLYRIFMTVIPMSIALIICFFRRPTLFISTYSIALVILLISTILFPETAEFAIKNSTRFTLPLVLGSALCLITIRDIRVIENSLYWISYIVFIIAIYYFYNAFIQGITWESYNMSFSYALLLPMSALYSRKQALPLTISGLMLMMVLILGSRGAAAFYIIYVIIDICLNNKRLIIPILGLVFMSSFIISMLALYLDDIGIHARTIDLLLDSDRSDHDSGRMDIYRMMIQVLNDNPLTGIGLFGDRIFFNGSYCHNIILEILLNFGYLFGSIIILFLVFKIIATYHISNHFEKTILTRYLITIVGPLMVSNSYLISYAFGIFIGILCVLRYHTSV